MQGNTMYYVTSKTYTEQKVAHGKGIHKDFCFGKKSKEEGKQKNIIPNGVGLSPQILYRKANLYSSVVNTSLSLVRCL